MDFGGEGELVSHGNENKFYFGNYTQTNEIENIDLSFFQKASISLYDVFCNK